MNKFAKISRYYIRHHLLSDMQAGVIVGTVALPLAISFAIASGLSPITGIFTTIFAGFIISVLSGSRVQIGGPTAATIVIIYGIVSQFGTNGLILASFMAGVLLILMGVFKVGRLIRLIPEPLIEGFTAGIAIDLFCSQFKDFWGLKMGPLPIDFLGKCTALSAHFDHVNIYALGLGLFTIAINQGAAKFVTHKIPGPIISVVLASVLAWVLKLPVETIGSKYGTIQIVLPDISSPHADWRLIGALFKPACTIALLVGILSLVSGIVAERVVGHKFKSNKELIAEGLANLFSSVYGGIPVTGSIARTMTNIENGGRTRVAGIMQSVMLLVIVFLVGKYIAFIPVASVAGLLIVVSYNMSKWRTFFAILRSGRGDAALLLVTFLVTLFVDVTMAIEAGFVFAAFQFMHRMTMVSNVKELTNNFMANNGLYIEEHIVKHNLPKGVAVFEITGPLFFAVAHKFKESLNEISIKPKIVILRMRNVPIIDSTGIVTLLNVIQSLSEQDIRLVISEYKYDRVDAKLTTLLISKLDKHNIHGTLSEAIERCEDILSGKVEELSVL